MSSILINIQCDPSLQRRRAKQVRVHLVYPVTRFNQTNETDQINKTDRSVLARHAPWFVKFGD